LKEQYLNTDKTNPKSIASPAPAVSRRTGIDRRWIPSDNHQPERRGGADRRAKRKRSFTDPLVSDDSEKKAANLSGIGAGPAGTIGGPTPASEGEGWPSLSDGQTKK